MYYNLVNWYRVLALLPGFSVNRRFMEQMMGVSETLPPVVAEAIEREATRGKLRDALHLASTVAGLVWQHVTHRCAASRAFYRAAERGARASGSAAQGRARPTSWSAHYRELRAALLLKWDAPLVNDFFAMIFYGVLRKLTTRWCGDAEGTLQNDLMGGEGGLVSAEPAARLMRMAALAARHPAFADLTRQRRPCGDCCGARRQQPAFDAEYREYLEKFGERAVNELKLETETLHDDPLPLWRAIGQLERQQRGRGQSSDGVCRPRAASQRRAPRLRGAVIASAPAPARSAGSFVTHGRASATARICGSSGRACSDGSAASSSSSDAGSMRQSCSAIHATSSISRSTRCWPRRGPLDLHLGPIARDAAPRRVRRLRARAGAAQPLRDARHRLARPDVREPRIARRRPTATSAAARVAAPASFAVRSASSAIRATSICRQRAILVAEHTDPGWILVLPSALGVLVERGSLLSHAAIVARELGIPSIVALPGITTWLADGDWVEMDGRAGTVKRIQSDGPSAEGGARA